MFTSFFCHKSNSNCPGPKPTPVKENKYYGVAFSPFKVHAASERKEEKDRKGRERQGVSSVNTTRAGAGEGGRRGGEEAGRNITWADRRMQHRIWKIDGASAHEPQGAGIAKCCAATYIWQVAEAIFHSRRRDPVER